LFSSANRVVAFGGSYSGTLAALLRMEYPSLVHAAVASSAPMKAQLDFAEYNEVVAASLASQDVGGSDQCRNNVKHAFELLDQKLVSNPDAVAKLFKSCKSLTNPLDQQQFLSTIMSEVQLTVQYNNMHTSPSISSMCATMEVGDDLLANLAATTVDSHDCVDYSYTTGLKQLQNIKTNVSSDQPVGERQWVFQTCTQFGFYQTCGDGCIFSHRTDLKFNMDRCQAVFGIDGSRISEPRDILHDLAHQQDSRVVFVNGAIDPWHVISVTSDLPGMRAVFIQGASHCQNMQEPSMNDSMGMRVAKEKIAEIINSWINNTVE